MQLRAVSGSKWAAESSLEAVVDVLIRSHLREVPFEGEQAIIKKARNYRISTPRDGYLTEREIKMALGKLLEEKMILLVNFANEPMWAGIPYPESISYRLSPLVKKNITRRWSPCPRYHPAEEQEEVRRTKAEQAKIEKAQEDAYQREKQRQEAAEEAAAFRKKTSRSHWIYYIQWASDPGFVKIGYSSTPVDRIPSFLTGSPGKLRLLRLEKVASQKEESERHDRFRLYHHRREWFKYEEDLKDYIELLDTRPGIELWERLSPVTRSEILVDFF